MTYKEEIFDLVKNSYFTYYKLSIDEECQFDEFMEKVDKVKADKESLEKIFAIMEMFSPRPLSKKLFRQIRPSNKNERIDLYEFKKDSVRVYVIFQRPNIYIVRGGLKKEQEKDIKKLKRETKDFKTQ